MNDLLTETQLAVVPKQNIDIFTKIYSTSRLAYTNVCNLSNCDNIQIIKFLSQINCFAQDMTYRSVSDIELSQTYKSCIDNFQNVLEGLQKKLNAIILDTTTIVSDKRFIAEQTKSIIELNKILKKHEQDYLYNNSNDMNNVISNDKCNEKIIDRSNALKKAKSILLDAGYKIKNIDYIGENKFPKSLQTYNFTASDDNARDIFVSITKAGGYLKLILCEPTNKNTKPCISQKEIIKRASDFLYKNDFTNLSVVSIEKFNDNCLTINFAPTVSSVVMQNQLIKVKIDLSDESIISCQTHRYFEYNNDIECTHTCSLDEVSMQNLLPTDFNVINIDNVVITTDYESIQHKIFCYKVLGKIKNKYVMIYINADTGKFEKFINILM
jgi:germination protein YpeB